MAPDNISNRDKIFFPAAKLTKGDLADYYAGVAKRFLRYSKGRAVTLRRFPDGIGEEGFFQKNTPDYFPDWFPTARLPTEKGTAAYPMIGNKRSLLYAVNQGVIEFHIALSKADQPRTPDRIVFDLDPSDNDFEKVRALAQIVKEKFDAADLPLFAMVTGSRGVHLVVSLRRSKAGNFDAVRHFAKSLADRLAEENPELATPEQRKAKRGKRVFVDYLRNAYGQTSIAPFSVRAMPGAPVSTPISWKELGSNDLTPQSFTIETLSRRLAQLERDPWADFFRSARTFKSVAGALDGKAVKY